MFSAPKEIRRNHALLFIATSVTLFLVWAADLRAVPADPEALVTVQQPGGSMLTIRPVGDEFNGRFETIDGYTVVRNTDGDYTFAERSVGGSLAPTRIIASNPENRTTEVQAWLSQIAKSLTPTNERALPKLQGPTATVRSTKNAVTNQNVLVILIQFPDVAPVYPLSDFENLMNQPNYDGYGSVRDFYLENSYNEFDLNGTVDGYYTASQIHTYYGYNDGDNWTASAQLAKQAILEADANGLDFAPFDNDNDGEVDMVFIVHTGPGAETGYSDYPWSHSWGLAWAGIGGVTVDGKYLNRYTMQPEKHNSTLMVRIGVFCHEYGHAIGLPDLYDTDGSSIGVGSWCLMSGGSWNGGGKSPSHLSAWCKSQLGFLTPINVLENAAGVVIPDVENNPVAYRLWSEGLGGAEYFLIEYRSKTLFDATLPGCGLAVWHIDETRTNNENDSRRLVDLVEADNSENSSVGDVWLNKTFDSLSLPPAVSYTTGNTIVSVNVTSATCESGGLVVNLGVGIEPSCCIGMRGNVDYDPFDEVTVGDITKLIEYMFKGGQVECIEEANVDGDTLGEINIADLTALVSFSFKSGNSPANCE